MSRTFTTNISPNDQRALKALEKRFPHGEAAKRAVVTAGIRALAGGVSPVEITTEETPSIPEVPPAPFAQP